MIKELKSDLKNNGNKKKKQNTPKGNWGEHLACHYLQAKGLKFVQHQYRTRLGEIDLVMQDNDEIVFIEVRYRQCANYISPEETVSFHKQQRLIRAAYHFQQYYAGSEDFSFRFDVVGISGSKLNPQITWIQNAFEVE